MTLEPFNPEHRNTLARAYINDEIGLAEWMSLTGRLDYLERTYTTKEAWLNR